MLRAGRHGAESLGAVQPEPVVGTVAEAHAMAAACDVNVAPHGTATRTLQVIDCHAAGEPARVVVGGLPHVPGVTVREKRLYMMNHLDGLRKLLLLEPRGYPCQNANYILPPVHPEAAFAFVIAEQNRIYPAMSGHNTICVATALLQTGMVPMVEPVTKFALEAPAGLVRIEAVCEHGRVVKVTLRNTAAFCRREDMDLRISVPQLGEVRVDVAFGGMHYVLVDAADVRLELTPENGREIARIGEMIKVATREQHPVNHPEYDYAGPDILAFRSETRRMPNGALAARNAVVMSNNELAWDKPSTWTGMLDRSPCGTGTCAIMALLHARGELAIGEDFEHESIIGTKFIGRLHEEVVVGEGTEKAVHGVSPSVSGRAWITQHATVVCDPSDPFPEGFTVGDIW